MKFALRVAGKYLDQPKLVEKLGKVVPLGLGACAAGYAFYDSSRQKTDAQKRRTFVRDGLVLGATVTSALAAPKIASAITGKKLLEVFDNKLLVDSFIRNKAPEAKIEKILKRAKTKVLSLPEVAELMKTLKSADECNFLNKLIPPPENVSSKDIFSEIGWLSIVGAVPVVGGVAGGLLADKATGGNWRKRLPDKIKEGSYQYLANIFLCNVGAGAALAILEKKNIKSRMARGLGMVGGIILTGVIGGSKIANFIGDKVINPLFGYKHTKKDERTPELIDIGLHTDDIATVSLLSGLKWIEPMLPILYTVSGYRAGIGYRNHKEKI